MSTATVERQMEILEQIHGLKRELQELAGDALEITIKPAKTNGKPRKREPNIVGPGPVEKVLAVFEAHPGEWLSPGDVMREARTNRTGLTRSLKKLRADGKIENNGKQRAATQDRLVGEGTAAPAASTPDVAAPPADTGNGAGAMPGEQPRSSPDPLPGGASSNGHRTSPRVEKSLQRAAIESAGLDTAEKPDLEQAVRALLEVEAQTLRELAENLAVEIPDVSRAVAELRLRGAVVTCGRRFPRKDVVYGLPGAEWDS